MGVGAGLYMCDVVKKFTFAISSPDEFLYNNEQRIETHGSNMMHISYTLLPRRHRDYDAV